jgi:hypothetical protein
MPQNEHKVSKSQTALPLYVSKHCTLPSALKTLTVVLFGVYLSA